MDFSLTDDQQVLVRTVRDYLAAAHGPEMLRRFDAGDEGDAIWQGLVEMGLPGLLVPEAQGGLGLGIVEGVLVAVECGRACLAVPLVDTAFVAVPWMVAEERFAELPAIARGEAMVTLPHAINAWAVNGDGAPLASVDPLRRLTAADGGTDDSLLLDLGALMTAAQLVGLAEAMLEQATAYAGIRHQFGQPIGAFQAVKHQLANCAVAIEFARPVLLRAAQALQDRLPSASVHVSHAKLAGGDAAWATAETAIHVHGAMGYTYEVDLHFWAKRSWALVGAWGDRAFHLGRMEEAIVGGALPIGPEYSFS